MKKFKKALAVVLAAAMLFALAACGGDKGTDGKDGQEDPRVDLEPRISLYV